jgi:hypothetical protein
MAEFDNTQDGHCLVPRRYQEDMSLGAWVSKQRQIHNKNKLGFHRQELLNDIGFVWRVVKYAPARIDRDPQWNKKYQTLVEFKSKNGHCLVPNMYQEDMSLGKWAANQRQLDLNNKLGLDRKGLLDDIGFVWSVVKSAPARTDQDTQWEEQYKQLVEFKRKNGHCIVKTTGWKEDMSLGKWVGNQRQIHSNNKLRLDRKGLLDELEFVWNV